MQKTFAKGTEAHADVLRICEARTVVRVKNVLITGELTP